MAGRKPRRCREEILGTDPLRPRKPGGLKPGEGGYGNAQPGSAAGHKLGAGNRAAAGAPGSQLTHGMTSARHVSARADAILAALLGHPACPDMLKQPLFAPHLISWSRREAVTSLAWEFMLSVLDAEGPAGIFAPRMGVVKTISEVWLQHDSGAGHWRRRLGMDPVSWIGISKDLSLAAHAAEDALQKAARAGAEITRRRGIEGPAGDGDVLDPDPDL